MHVFLQNEIEIQKFISFQNFASPNFFWNTIPLNLFSTDIYDLKKHDVDRCGIAVSQALALT